MVSVCLPSDALLQHLPSYLGFSYLGRGVSLHSCSSKAHPLLLTLDMGYLLTTAVPDLQSGIAPLGPPVPAQPPLLWLLLPAAGPGSGARWLLLTAPDLNAGCLLPAPAPGLGCGVAPQGHCPWPQAEVASPGCPCPLTQGSSSRPPPLTSDAGCLHPAAAPDLERGVSPPSRHFSILVLRTP